MIKQLTIICLLLGASFTASANSTDDHAVTISCHPPTEVHITRQKMHLFSFCWSVSQDGFDFTNCSADQPGSIKGEAFESYIHYTPEVGYGQGPVTEFHCKYHNSAGNKVGTTHFFYRGRCVSAGNNSYQCQPN